MWKHLRAVNKGLVSTVNNIPDELLINNEHFSDSHTIATKLKEYFLSIAQILNSTNTETTDLDLTKVTDFVNNKVPERIYFDIYPLSQPNRSYHLFVLWIHLKPPG